ncbi:MAG: CsiV family protein [Gammaproteobacteria bacterium]
MDYEVVMIRMMLLFLLCLHAAGAAALSEAEDRWFEVEVLIFTVDDENAVATEHWPENPGTPRGEAAIELAPALLPVLGAREGDEARAAVPPVIPYQLLPVAEQRLTAMENRLALSGQFTPFLHLAWRQPAFSRQEAGGAVHIHWDEEGAAAGPVPTAGDSLAAPPSALLAGAELFSSEAGRQRARLDGLITVSVNRYLHFNVDLLYDNAHEEADQGSLFRIFNAFASEQPPHLFRMQQSRRLRSGELHYFDHPRFGMIALVTPYEYPQPAAATEGEQVAPETSSETPDEVLQ